MKQLRLYWLYFTLALLSVFIGCEKYVGYSFESQPLANRTTIFGTVINYYTGEPVVSARVRVGIYEISTNIAGKFNVIYFTGKDEERDKPVFFSITAPDFYPYQEDIIIYPVQNEINVELFYASPIINRHYIGWHQSGSGETYYVVQAEIIDYQGIETIDSTLVTFHITDGEQQIDIYRGDIDLIESSDISAYFHISVTPRTFRPWRLLNPVEIQVWDIDGNTDRADLANTQDKPLIESLLP